MRWRKTFKPNVPCHVYSRGHKSFCIFYNLSDFLVFTTIYHFYARKYGIRTIALCLMVNHYHCVVLAPSKEAFTRFIQTVESVFAKQYNAARKRSGPVFQHRFGWAPKEIGKKARSCIIYVNNNPVTGSLCRSAMEYRWNYLSFYKNPSPFSSVFVKRQSSRRLSRAVDYLSAVTRRGDKFLGYPVVLSLLKDLSSEEVQQLADIIITRYNPIDYCEMIKYFGSFENAVLSMQSNTGDEHDLKEDWDDYSIYRKMLAIARDNGNIGIINFENAADIHKIHQLIIKFEAIGATRRQIRKFLHISPKYRSATANVTGLRVA